MNNNKPKHRIIRINKNKIILTKELMPKRMRKALSVHEDGSITFDDLLYYSLFDLYNYEKKTERARNGFIRRHGYQYPAFLNDIKKTLKKYEVIE